MPGWVAMTDAPVCSVIILDQKNLLIFPFFFFLPKILEEMNKGNLLQIRTILHPF